MHDGVENDLAIVASTYKPRPILTDDVSLPAVLVELCELLAANAHDVWARERQDRGWHYGQHRDDHQQTHPCLVPYEHLSEEEKELDRVMTREVLRVIVKLGFRIERDSRPRDADGALPANPR